ncbi:MAG: V-type ATPase subunit [Clostridia bacterium]|nr:V-type ATPase subunit [Clostridia bacterium]
MSDKFVFQNAKIKHMESKLITSQSVQRLIECQSANDAFKVLLEMGFGAGIPVDTNDFDALFSHEEENAVALLKEFNVGNALDAFMVEIDYLNLKSAFKAHATGTDFSSSLVGLYDVNEMKSQIEGVESEKLPKEMKEAVSALLELEKAEKLSPRVIDVTVDKAMYKHILSLVKKSGNLAKRYYIKKIDYLNILSFLRVQKLSLPLEFFVGGFIEGGTLARELFESSFDSVEKFKENTKPTEFREIVEKVADDKDVVALEVAMDNDLLKMFKDENNDLFSISPIVSYYLTKRTEIKLTKLIVAGIKNHDDPQLIRERMREIYA